MTSFYILILLAIGIDQGTKLAVRRFLALNQSVTVIPGILSFTYIQNPGAAFGILKHQTLLFLLLTLALLYLVLKFRRRIPEQAPAVRIGVALGLGGALGNLIDRVRLGKVVDFLDLDFRPLENWPVFNLADSAIVAGAVLIFIHLLKRENRERGGIKK